MKIVVDKNIPFAQQLFSTIGDVSLVDGRRIGPDTIKDTDMLIVRTITAVNRALLEGSHVKFVGSTTSGMDHIDVPYLRDSGIEFAYAPGSNARSVAEYVLSAICVLADQHGFEPRQKRIGIIGCGHVGSEVLRFMQTLGMECIVNDPLLQDKTGDELYRDLEEVLAADIITLHVPLTNEGPCPTAGMVDQRFLARLNQDVILINAARGQVADDEALLQFMDKSRDARLVIDTWSGEPGINTDLLNMASIATPHIAGYSLDGKLRASRMVFQQACRHLAVEHHDTMLEVMLDKLVAEVSITDFSGDMEAVQMAVLASYDVRSDSATLRRMVEIEAAQRAGFFDDLRNNYPIRREFHAMHVKIPHTRDHTYDELTALGFQVSIV